MSEERLAIPPAAPWTDGTVDTPLGPVARVRTSLSGRDRLGALKVRLGMGRGFFTVPPGLYAVGAPAAHSPVSVSANYKLSFDHLRSHVAGRDAWILVLDTKGINVWCAAGKGTFGTDEVVRRVRETGLHGIVSHRKLVLPQLGAPGVAAHLVRAATGFHVVYGPVRAADLRAFLDDRMQAEPGMRRVRFDLVDRLVLVPVEIVHGARKAAALATVLLLLSDLGPRGFSGRGARPALLFFASFILTGLLGPMLLPWLPGRAFAAKGAALGLALGAVVASAAGLDGWLAILAWMAMVSAFASHVVMNFTGATTFTSLSGVLAEMRWAVPAQLTVGGVGLVVWFLAPFVYGGVR